MSFDLWVGSANWMVPDGGGFTAHALAPVNDGYSVCDEPMNALMLEPPNPSVNPGPGQWLCDGCDAGSNAWDWIISEMLLGEVHLTDSSAEVGNNLRVEYWPSDNDNYWVTDDNGKWHAVCTWPSSENWADCTKSGPVDLVWYLECHAVPDRGDDYTVGLEFAY